MPDFIVVHHEDLDFDAPGVNDEFDPIIEVSKQQQKMQQGISKQTIFYLIFQSTLNWIV
jgi:hypothetical protein